MEKGYKFYITVEDAWEAMYAVCRSAQKSIDFESYIFYDDAIGKKFLALFIKKAGEGVRVRLLFDGVGSSNIQLLGPLDKISDAGIQLQFFNVLRPWQLRTFGRWFFRDHRKILIVDGEIGFTGGVGINDDMKDWRDTQVEVRGPVVSQMIAAFSEMWKIAQLGKFSPIKAPEMDGNKLSFFTNAPHRRQRFFYYELSRRIQAAKKYIYMTTPYFIPDGKFFRLMREAAKRGVDFRLLTGKRSDIPWIDRATFSFFGSAMKSGIKVFVYTDVVMHAKTVVVDDVWATAGSANIDNLGLLWNHEANLVATDKNFIGDVKAQFLHDLKNSEAIDAAAWRHRPFTEKFLEATTWPFRLLL